MAESEGDKVTLAAKKIGGNRLLFTYHDGTKSITWEADAADVDVEILRDIVHTVAGPDLPPIPPTVPLIPLGGNPELFIPPPSAPFRSVSAPGSDWGFDEEVRLKNMGSALSSGVGLPADAIPVFNGEAGDQLPPVNWSA